MQDKLSNLKQAKLSNLLISFRKRIQSYSGPYSVRMRENTGQNSSGYEHFLRRKGVILIYP